MMLKSILEEPFSTDVLEDSLPAKSSYPPQRILLVDDDRPLRRMIAAVLSASGYQVDTADDGEAGWQALHAESYTPDGYDLLITDNNMPRLSGVSLIKKARSARLNLPVILASGDAPEHTESLRLAALLHKPFTADELVTTVKKALHTASV